jgi:hypothetical protein
MNQRIQELVEQASSHMPGRPPYDGLTFDVFNKEKFAQLIVAQATECVRDVLRDEKSDLSYAAASQVQKRIKEFFGVEE